MPNKTTPVQTYFHIMAKPIGPLCNLQCDYCFYLHKEHMLSTQTQWRISDEILEEFIDQYINEQTSRKIVFSWQGGEPTLLGLDFFKKVIELEKKYANGKQIENDLQTNGVLLDEEFCCFLKENNFLVGLSIDGPEELHDKHRRDKGNQPTFQKVFQAAKLLQQYRVPFNALVTLNYDNAKKPLDLYRFIRDNITPRAIQFNACVEAKTFCQDAPPYWDTIKHPQLGDPAARPRSDDSVVYEWSVDPDDYGNFLIEVFNEWYRHDVGKIFIYNFEYALMLWLGNPMEVGCVFGPVCGKCLAIEHNGDVYSCDHFVYPKYRLGNIKQKTLSNIAFSRSQIKFGMDKKNGLPQYCRDCVYLFACNGGCPKNRIIRTPIGEPGLNYLCSGLKKYFKHIDPYMNKLKNTFGH
ncbi:MAG: anaerobic sulfatase maturase [bacterium]